MDFDVTTRMLIKAAILPPGVILIPLMVGWLFARRWFGRILLLLGIVLLYGLSTPVGNDWLAGQIETMPALTPDQLHASGADGVLIFLAGVERDSPEHGGRDWLSAMSLQRLDYGLLLHHETALPIVLSGGSVDGETQEVAKVGALWLEGQTGIKPVAIETDSRDTWENAQYSAKVLARHNLKRVLLVTHAYHMPRAVLSARAAGIDVIPAPFGFHSNAADDTATQFADWLPFPRYLSRSYLALHEMVGLVWYGLTRDSQQGSNE